jgi:chorismate--pyruvate lyase
MKRIAERWLRRLAGNAGGYRPWLLDRGSLTLRLKACCPDFAVRGVREEAMWLPRTGRALVREVFLCCGETPVVYAYSILPLAALTGHWKRLARLGTKPLGLVLFKDPRVGRSPLQFKKFGAHQARYARALAGAQAAPAHLWARRSEFRLPHGGIWVTEVFLPAVLELGLAGARSAAVPPPASAKGSCVFSCAVTTP